MEIVIMTICAVAAISCLGVNFMIAFMIWRHLYEGKKPQAVSEEETPEEAEARRVAARAQTLYEQGFVNLMEFDGKPQKKDGEDR